MFLPAGRPGPLASRGPYARAYRAYRLMRPCLHGWKLRLGILKPLQWTDKEIGQTYDTRCYFNVRSKANVSQPNLPHGLAEIVLMWAQWL